MDILLSKQVNHNQIVVKCQILQECFLQNFYMQKFKKKWNIQIQGLFKNFQELSRAWIFFQNSRTFKDFSRTLWTL